MVPRQLKTRVGVRDFEYIQHYMIYIYIRTMYDVAQILNFIYLSLFHIFSTVSVKNIPRTYTLKELNILTFGAL